jgi:hypothetical protein
MKSTTIGNENINYAVCGLRLDMHEVRTVDGLYQAILKYLKTCFMQDGSNHKSNEYPTGKMFSVWGENHIIKHSDDDIIIRDFMDSPVVTLHVPNSDIINIIIDGNDFEELLKWYAENFENELVWKALSRLKNELGAYFRVD